ncbi:MAG: virulence factor SrfC family protein, partial [Rhodovulum sp.]
MTTQDQLAERCARVEEAARRALDWVNDPENAETVGLDRKSLVQALRKGARRAQKLGKSARTKMSVSVFGPSQAGKSFLVSVLARPQGGRLVADFQGPGGELDYIREINPEGEGESTGLVTRFTMTKAPCPEGYPIRLVLLSEADCARTIINSFYMDGDQSEPAPEPERITAHLDAFRAKMGPAEVPGMSFEDVLEIAEYVNKTFGRSAYAAGLKSFWEDAALIAPNLSIRDRAEFCAILWGGHEPLTGLFVQLAEALQQIQNAEEVHAPLSALTPRETSIIDVKTLHGLHEEGGDTLSLCLPSGAKVDLPRALVCALAAELVMPMQTQPYELFAETDLLDFPGARNRFEQPLSKTLAEPEKTLTQLLLRGKVAYLFDRYVENQEITSMLLCVPDSNMETLDLPGLVETWIEMTHGGTPKQRAETRCILFFVLTKFDKHLGESAAGGGEATRFERRMQASLLEKFGRGKDPWVESWTPGQPFRNCYWLRNPNFFVEGLIDYDETQRELRIRDEKADRVAELREGCLEAPSVQKHFADPAAAWDAALSLNDGGVSYLIAQLTEVCTADSKIRQVGSQLDKLAADLREDMSPFHISDDVGQRIEEKRAAAAEIIDELEIALQRHRFGAFLGALMVDQDQVQDRIARVPSSIRITQAVA